MDSSKKMTHEEAWAWAERLASPNTPSVLASSPLSARYRAAAKATPKRAGVRAVPGAIARLEARSKRPSPQVSVAFAVRAKAVVVARGRVERSAFRIDQEPGGVLPVLHRGRWALGAGGGPGIARAGSGSRRGSVRLAR